MKQRSNERSYPGATVSPDLPRSGHLVGACVLAACWLAGAGACGPTRTAAATQHTTVTAPTSDPKATEVIDEVVAKLGGTAAWNAVKQLQWEVSYVSEGKRLFWASHAWDIWNGRHRYEFAEPKQLEQAGDDPGAVDTTIAMYDLFDHEGKGFVTAKSRIGKAEGAAMSDARDRVVKAAYEAWQRDHYQIAMLHKLRDPGVALTYVGERDNFPEKCKPSCIDIKVTFAAEVGTDTYHVYVNKDSRMPELIEQVRPDGKSLIMRLDNWTEVAGLKFPQTLKNIGPNEEFRIENIAIGEPVEELYVPQIR